HNGVEVVFDLHGPVSERGAVDPAAAEHAVEFFLVASVIRYGGGGVLQLMASEDAHDSLPRIDHAFFTEQFRTGNTGSTGRLAAKAACTNLCLGVQNLLVRDFPNYAVHALQRAQAFEKVHRTINLDCAGNGIGPQQSRIELGIIVVNHVDVWFALVPT